MQGSPPPRCWPFLWLPSPAWLVRVIGLAWCLATGAAAADAWIVAWKDRPSDSDASARVFVCDRIQDVGDSTWFYTGARKKSFARDQSFSYARMEPGVPSELTNQQQFDSLKFHYERLSGFAKQYPSSHEFLVVRLATMRKMIGGFQAGKIYASGKWVPRKEYLATLEKSTLARHSGTGHNPDPKHPGTQSVASQRAAARNLAYATVGGIAIYLVSLIAAMICGLRKLTVLLILLPCLAAGWLRYRDGDFEWAKNLRNFLIELPAQLKLPDKPADKPAA